ncbi:Two-component response regulator ARR14 [Euphorbia peplus]|nr:Two-component response regulator ARR14 [Euphorbia peplus]
MEDGGSLVPSFAKGISILLVDNDKASLMYLSSMLEHYSYKVSSVELTANAMWMVQEEKEKFKLVMANFNVPDMDTLQFLHFLLNKDIPLILVSSENNISEAKKAIAEGASFYFDGPILMDDLKYIWQHAYRNKKTIITNHIDNINAEYGHKIIDNGKTFQEMVAAINDTNQLSHADFEMMNMDNMQRIEKNICKKLSQTGQLMTITNIPKENVSKTKKRPKEDQQEQLTKVKKVKQMHEQMKRTQDDYNNGNSNSNSGDKKSRIVWTPDLHLKFTAAISELGDKKARPKAILEMMNVPTLSARQVASHLQKYRFQVQRICETGITNLPAVSRSSNFYGWTRSFETIEQKTTNSPTLQHYQAKTNSNFGNLFEIFKHASSSNNYPPVVKYNQNLNDVDVSNPSRGEESYVMDNSTNDGNGDGKRDYCLDEWMNEILNPDEVEMSTDHIESTVKTTNSSGDAYQRVLNVLEGGFAVDEPDPYDVDRYCNWLTDAVL